MQISISNPSDLVGLAQCHRKAFPRSLSSYLGNNFIRKMLSWYIDDKRGVLFHVVEGGNIVGYCGGIIIKQSGLPGAATSITQHSFNSFLKAFLIRPWLIFHTENRKRALFTFKNILYKIGLKKPVSVQVPKQEFKTSWGLVVIGVDPSQQGKGVGSVLLSEFERLAREDNVEYINLTVKKENGKAIRAYRKNGWSEKFRSNDSISMHKKL